MKVKCLNCGTIIDIEESEYPVGIEQTIECPLCQEKVSFTIKDESKTSEVLPPSISAVKGPIKVKSRVAKSGNNHPEESSQNNQNENKENQSTSDESLDDKIAKWEEASQQTLNNSGPFGRLVYYLGYYHNNIKKGLICICALIALFFVGKFFWNNYQSRPSGIKVDTDSIAELVDSISDESIVNESDSIISFLRLMYENSDYNNYPFLNGHCTQHLLSVLSEAYDYDCNESPCYATWLFRTQSQDYKSSTENESRVISVKDLGDNWFEIEFYDGGWKGIKKIKAYFKDGNIVMDMIETVFDEAAEDVIAHDFNPEVSLNHHFTGTFTDSEGVFPVELDFTSVRGNAVDVIYKNVTLGGKIRMTCTEFTKKALTFTGKDGRNTFTINLHFIDNNTLRGKAVDGNKTLDVEMKAECIHDNNSQDADSVKVVE